MGGLNAFKDLPAFPETHAALRIEMEKIKMITRMAPGTLDVEMGAPVVVPMSIAERANLRKSRGPRALDSRKVQLDASTIAHLDEETRAKVTREQDKLVKKKLQEEHLKHHLTQKGGR
jgi:hypothetical protein